MIAETLSASAWPPITRWGTGISAVLGLAAAAGVYANSFAEFASAWNHDSVYLFGHLIAPLAVVAASATWLRGGAPPETEVSPANLHRGMRMLFAGVAAHFAALFFRNLAVDVIALILIVRGIVAMCAGYQTLRRYDFATLFLAFLIPVTLPLDFFPALTGSLQYLVAFGSAALIDLAGVPVFRDGLELRFGGLTLSVDAARCGLQAWEGVLACCLAVGFTGGYGIVYRTTMALLSLPIAVAVQGLGLVAAGTVFHWRGQAAAEETVRRYDGWLPVVVAIGLTLAAALALHAVALGLHSVATIVPRKLKGTE